MIDKLTVDDVSSLTELKDINVHVEGFFRNLYTTSDTSTTTTETTFTSTRVIPEDCEANKNCIDEFTYGELFDAIKKSPSRKSTSPDGILKEFYHRAFSIINRELLLVLNEALLGKIPESFVDGVIVLVRKRGGRCTMSAFRPISLLNADYKLLSRMVKHRLDGIIGRWEIISAAQKCCN